MTGQAEQHGRSSIRIGGLKKSFNGRLVVDVESVVLGERPIEGLIGPNGAGKTTLMSLVTGRLAPDSGSVTFNRRGDAIDIAKMSLDAVARLGLVCSNQLIQDFESLTICDSLLLSSCSHRHERFWRLGSEKAMRAEAKDAIDHYLDFFEFENPKGHALSAGEKKLLDIIRCLLLRPSLLLMDEPTAGLPQELTAKVMQLLQRETAERDLSVVVIEHDLELIWGICERVHFLAEGALVCSGAPEEIRTNALVAEKYMGAANV